MDYSRVHQAMGEKGPNTEVPDIQNTNGHDSMDSISGYSGDQCESITKGPGSEDIDLSFQPENDLNSGNWNGNSYPASVDWAESLGDAGGTGDSSQEHSSSHGMGELAGLSEGDALTEIGEIEGELRQGTTNPAGFVNQISEIKGHFQEGEAA